jgi:AcrR family transcriptional regulator
LIARYFGTKEGLLREIALRIGAGYAKAVADAKDPVDGFVRGFDYFVEMPARAAIWIEPILYNVAASLPSAHQPMSTHLAQLAREGVPTARPADGNGETKGDEGDDEPNLRTDPRLMVMVALALTGGWAVIEDFAMAAHLSSYPRESVRREIRRLLSELIDRELLGHGKSTAGEHEPDRPGP